MTRELKGRHVLAIFLLGFGTIIAANLTLAVNAVRTFPGLEVKNSYVASQKFEAARDAQDALNWDVSATLTDTQLVLTVSQAGQKIHPEITKATFGRATSVAEDQSLTFSYSNGAFTAPVRAGAGNWNLRLEMVADNGALFSRRIVARIAQ